MSEPGEIDLDKPNAARVYDYYLGGDHNFAVDRQMGDEAIRLWPELPLIMQANRAFLRRAVHYCVEQGIRQFLDLGSGIPTVGNVHEVAQLAAPGSRVVYVDTDPVAVAYSKNLLADNADADIVRADARQSGHALRVVADLGGGDRSPLRHEHQARFDQFETLEELADLSSRAERHRSCRPLLVEVGVFVGDIRAPLAGGVREAQEAARCQRVPVAGDDAPRC